MLIEKFETNKDCENYLINKRFAKGKYCVYCRRSLYNQNKK